MRKRIRWWIGCAVFVPCIMPATPIRALAQEAASARQTQGSLEQYLSPSADSEIALARSAAPASISKDARVLVLTRTGYETAVPGRNGFVCMVGRSWVGDPAKPGYWNPRVRAPICFNPPSARTFLPIYLMKTRLVLGGRSRAEIDSAIASALNTGTLPKLAPGSMCYMMSRQQYLNDDGKQWRPHVMYYASADADKKWNWGANLAGSPVIVSADPEERVTVFMVLVPEWSDGTLAPPMAH